MIAQVSYGIPGNFSGAGLALTPEEGRAYRPKRISLPLQGLEKSKIEIRAEGVSPWSAV